MFFGKIENRNTISELLDHMIYRRVKNSKKGKYLASSMTIVLLLLFIAACKPAGPESVHAGEHRCEHCHMGIVDLRFDAQVITGTGKRFYFDSLECLASYLSENKEEGMSVWVSDLNEPDKWIELDDAHIVQSKDIQSPMGGHLGAFSSLKEIKKLENDKNLKTVSIEKFLHSNLKTWQKNASREAMER